MNKFKGCGSKDKRKRGSKKHKAILHMNVYVKFTILQRIIRKELKVFMVVR
jgi:hypothetical protein